MRIQRVTAIAAGLLWASQAAAVNTEGHEMPYFAAFFAHEFPDSNRDSDNGKGFQVLLGAPLSWGENNALELSFYDVERARNIDGEDDYQRSVQIDFVHDLGLFGWGDQADAGWLPQFKPFVLGGALGVQDDVRGHKEYTWGLDAGAGLLVPLPWYGAAVRLEGRVQGQSNDVSVPREDLLLDYRVALGVQIPLTPLFGEPKMETPRAAECGVGVVGADGRSDCGGSDSDGDAVLDGLDQCPGTPVGTPVDERGCPRVLSSSTGAMDSDADSVPDAADTCPGTKAGIVVDMSGCAVDQTMSLKSIYFTNDTAELTADDKQILDQVVATLRGQPNLRVEIGGHTDSLGGAAYNLMLSQQRAESVRQYLIGRGIDGDRLIAQGYGEFKPAGPNDTPDAQAGNRRVEFKLIVQ